LQKFSYLNSSNVGYIDELFLRYSENPDSIDSSWRYFFEGLELGSEIPAPSGNGSAPSSSETSATRSVVAPATSTTAEKKLSLGQEAGVAELILAYREFGKFLANVNPLSPPPSSHPLIDMSHFGLTQADLSKTFAAGRLIGLEQARLSEILEKLRSIYCSSVGIEYFHIQNPTEHKWLQEKIENTPSKFQLDPSTKKKILRRMAESETFERFLHTRYVAQKRFSIEGAESMIPALDCMIEVGAELGAEEFVFGMAHRGRLNVLTNIFGKKPEYIFTEFEGAYKFDKNMGEGDVKYHMGFSADLTTRKGRNVHLSLASNPSHLEFINPVVEGMTRAKQVFLQDQERTKVIPILIHGDAAFAGQGVCYETLNLSQLKGYATGGTLHIVINNQVGFTTSPEEARSTTYSTDLAKMLEVPIFHVNGDDPEALWWVSSICIEYRQKFKKDAVIDLICYRRHGHNEGDEPSFTQPLLYKKIKAHPSSPEIYAKKLISEKIMTSDDAEALTQELMSKLTEAQAKTKAEAPQPFVSVFKGRWKNIRRPHEDDLFKSVTTSVDEKTLKNLANQLNRMPAGFSIHPKLSRFFESRLKAVEEGKGIDWGNAETLAFATLVNEGNPVRLSGQDAERGTFTHRHSVLHDVETGELYTPLNNIRPGQAKYDVFNSHLSEIGVLGFEYGYSLADPDSLVIWEAQFGDFSNGAQVIIDQFISSGESKWQRMSGLTMLLPHGFEGQGPEHSSARLERFLQLSGKNNIFVCNLTTPGQIFHALRRQVKRDFRKPLVIMSPKSLLRNPLAVSVLNEFTQKNFEEVLDDPQFESDKDAATVKKVILCSGKVYYDLLSERNLKKIGDIALIRVEQLYPWPGQKLSRILNRYKNASPLVWVQEEPRNMGAWSYIFNLWSGGFGLFQESVGNRPIQYVGRDFGASPAVGSHKVHEHEQEELIQKALKL
jgi:2-oxoglutarate dehydrogenase E1 component